MLMNFFKTNSKLINHLLRINKYSMRNMRFNLMIQIKHSIILMRNITLKNMLKYQMKLDLLKVILKHNFNQILCSLIFKT